MITHRFRAVNMTKINFMSKSNRKHCRKFEAFNKSMNVRKLRSENRIESHKPYRWATRHVDKPVLKPHRISADNDNRNTLQNFSSELPCSFFRSIKKSPARPCALLYTARCFFPKRREEVHPPAVLKTKRLSRKAYRPSFYRLNTKKAIRIERFRKCTKMFSSTAEKITVRKS